MAPPDLRRLARMDSAEVAWRLRTATRTLLDRARCAASPPRWSRHGLCPLLARGTDLQPARVALSEGRWLDAHHALSRHFAETPPRFLIACRLRQTLAGQLVSGFPGSAGEAAARADRILDGEYDLLGYRGLRFSSDPPAALPDWHVDPVHARRTPRAFWSVVPYLDAACGDHKIIWELNRHQHWLALGRAFWLTGDRRYRSRAIAELGSWVDANPPLVGINWASMLELALRSISWLWALHFFVDPEAARSEDRPWTVDLLLALDRQLAHVERNLSYYFSPNTHLLGEALALYVAGRTLPELVRSRRREAIGRRILLAEADRQIASDGGHCERSTHYHRYALDFYVMAAAVARITDDRAAASALAGTVARLGAAARLLADEAGRVPHLGDDDGGALVPIAGRPCDDLRDSLAAASLVARRPDLQVGPIPEEAYWVLGHPVFGLSPPDIRLPTPDSRLSLQARGRVRSAALPETGYYVSRSDGGDHIVIDGGPHGYQNGGHAHADALSLTWSVRGVPLLIDPGTGCYTVDSVLRDRLRSTASHNTLMLDHRPQSVARGPFHWSRVATSRVCRWQADERFDYFDGSHDGYGPAGHRRRVLVLHDDALIVLDRAGGDGPRAAEAHWHVDSRWSVEVAGRRAVLSAGTQRATLVVPDGRLERFVADGRTGLGWQSPAYGRLEPATTIRVTVEGRAPFWVASVFGANPDNAIVDVAWLPVEPVVGAIDHAAALRIIRTASVDRLIVAEPVAGTGRIACRTERFETDARMLYVRTFTDGRTIPVAQADGTTVSFHHEDQRSCAG